MRGIDGDEGSQIRAQKSSEEGRAVRFFSPLPLREREGPAAKRREGEG
jgi:hypothetical protein